MAEAGFDFQKFIEDSKSVLTAPKEYFSSMPKTGGFVEPLIKATIYGLVAGVLYFIWGLLHLSAGAGMLGGMIGGGIGVMAIIGSIIGAIIGLFIGAIILLVVSAICGGSTDFEANVRVSASLMVLSPVSALLSFATGINLWLGGIVSLCVSLYGIYLLYHALINALQAKEGSAKVISIILAAFIAIVMLSSLTCYKAASTVSDKYRKDMEQLQQNSDEAIKSSEEALKNLNKMMEQMQKQAE